MNCREAEQQIFAERDGALDDIRRAALVQHVGQCSTCRRVREGLAQAVDSLRASTEAVRVPDADLEWQKFRRVINGGMAKRSPARPSWFGWLMLPSAVAAALMVMFFVNPSERGQRVEPPVVARANVEASVENASPVVFVDDKSGWVFVWSTNDPKHI